jgi:signal transduction histidine kinase
MSERLRLVGGRLSVKSELMQGTEIFAEVPDRLSEGGPRKSTAVGNKP